jgi:hypothetical protein
MYFGNLTTNVNPTTNIRYGVASHHSYNDLVDHIMQNGNDLAYDYFVSEIKASFETFVDQTSHDGDRAFIQSEIESVTKDLPIYPKLDQDDYATMVDEVLDPTSEDSLGDRLYDLISDNLQYENYSDNLSYELEENGCKYGLSSDLIWVYESTKIVYVRSLCSPCVPNAGDLDSGLTTQDLGYECYGIPDNWL